MRAIPWGRAPLNVLLAVLALVLSVLPSPTPAAAQSAGCTFTLGFRALHDQIPQIVGDCTENEHFNQANGNAEQRTARGLLVWRKADNWTAFTDGATTWINGPAGLASRPNAGPLFPWESRSAPAPAAAPSGSGMATQNQSGWATVTQIIGPATLAVRNDAGERFNVWHIGLIGPTEGQGDWLRRAAVEQSNRIPPGTRVWLQAEDGLENPDAGVVLRHVLRDADPNKPVGAELVRAGGVWVFPHAHHRYAQLYANLQAEAVVTRTGARSTPVRSATTSC